MHCTCITCLIISKKLMINDLVLYSFGVFHGANPRGSTQWHGQVRDGALPHGQQLALPHVAVLRGLPGGGAEDRGRRRRGYEGLHHLCEGDAPLASADDLVQQPPPGLREGGAGATLRTCGPVCVCARVHVCAWVSVRPDTAAHKHDHHCNYVHGRAEEYSQMSFSTHISQQMNTYLPAVPPEFETLKLWPLQDLQTLQGVQNIATLDSGGGG